MMKTESKQSVREANMEYRRVLLVYTPSLLSESIHHILDEEPGITVVKAVPLAPEHFDVVETVHPDVIVVVEGEPTAETTAAVGLLLQRCGEVPLIRVGLEESSVRIHRSEQLPASLAELKNVLKQIPASLAP